MTYTNPIEFATWLEPADNFVTREEWLTTGISFLWRGVFPQVKHPKWRVTVGWPKGSRGGKHSIGQCWDKASSDDGTYEIFISPELDNPLQVLETLAHEMCHAIVGCEAGHKDGFPVLCKLIGLQKPWTSTTAGPLLASILRIYSEQLGVYPHARLNDMRKRQTTRMLKATCPNPDCEVRIDDKPYTVRMSQQWADAGMPSCPCGSLMELDGQEEKEQLAA